ncbi:hypothetical protein FA95DRAFT_312846 [Auriscalpium vulgare]|uniref:Uncharacterized protein n=1 Tax=Auriscalpium vulgare TaxID=40419 RepID=A0ACB8S5G1_9AGAM|nr:hypothetical protein FA95DRAFT_312846 [Auriscalpium vulgare]
MSDPQSHLFESPTSSSAPLPPGAVPLPHTAVPPTPASPTIPSAPPPHVQMYPQPQPPPPARIPVPRRSHSPHTDEQPAIILTGGQELGRTPSTVMQPRQRRASPGVIAPNGGRPRSYEGGGGYDAYGASSGNGHGNGIGAGSLAYIPEERKVSGSFQFHRMWKRRD